MCLVRAVPFDLLPGIRVPQPGHLPGAELRGLQRPLEAARHLQGPDGGEESGAGVERPGGGGRLEPGAGRKLGGKKENRSTLQHQRRNLHRTGKCPNLILRLIYSILCLKRTFKEIKF